MSVQKVQDFILLYFFQGNIGPKFTFSCFRFPGNCLCSRTSSDPEAPNICFSPRRIRFSVYCRCLVLHLSCRYCYFRETVFYHENFPKTLMCVEKFVLNIFVPAIIAIQIFRYIVSAKINCLWGCILNYIILLQYHWCFSIYELLLSM